MCQRGVYLSHDVIIVEAGDKIGHVEVDDGVLVEVLLKRGVIGNRQVSEKTTGVDRMVVVGAEHFRRHRFTEAAASGNATEPLPCKE